MPSINIAPKSSYFPRILVTIEEGENVYRVVETQRGSRGEGHFVVKQREAKPNALGEYDWEAVTGEGFHLVGPMAREYYNHLYF